MIALFWRSLKDRRISLLIYNLAALLFAWMYIALFPYIRDQAEQLMEAFRNYPESLFAAFGIRPETMIFDQLENFLALEHFSLIWPIMIFALFISWGGSALAGEVEKGTIEILLSQPLSRLKIFAAKYFSGVLALVMFVIVSIGGIIPLAIVYDLEYKAANYWSMGVLGFLLGLAIFSLSIFFSALFSEKGRTYFLSAGLIILMYVANIVSALKENLSDLKYTSFFYYYDFNAALLENQISAQSYWVFCSVAAVFTLLAVIWFIKKDITV